MMNAFVENVKKKVKVPPKKTKKKKSEKKNEAEEHMVPGTIYIGHIPHGFFEREMRSYFSQFGKILNLRLARSRKTGGSKGFGYIQFESEAVAKIVAETMNNYLFFEKVLKCKFVPEDEPKDNVFRVWSRGMIRAREKNRLVQNRDKSKDYIEKSVERRSKRFKKLQKCLETKRIKFDMSSFIPKEK